VTPRRREIYLSCHPQTKTNSDVRDGNLFPGPIMWEFWSRMSYKRASPDVQPRFPSLQEAEGN